MESKIYKLLDEGVHEYDLKVSEDEKGVLYELWFSNGEQWTKKAKSKLALSMLNHGSGVKFNKKLKNIGFDMLECVRLLVDFEHFISDTGFKTRFTVVNQETILEL
jgi:hypothetical protein